MFVDISRATVKSDMEKVDRHIITPEEYEEIPEMTREMAETGDLYVGDKLIRRGRPPKVKKKVAISIRLSEDVLNAFKRCGPGWQTRIDEALEQWLEEHPEQENAPQEIVEQEPVTAKAPSGRGGSKPASPRPRPKR
jgi:uncharacterized protein (DUF4415 family)